jgi:hypothetical protein
MQTVPETHTHDEKLHVANEAEQRKEKLKYMAMKQGAAYGAVTLGVSSIATYFLNKHHAGFRNFASINAKVSIPIMLSMFMTSLITEKGLHDVIVYPEKWDGGKPATNIEKFDVKPTDISELNPVKRLLLKIYDNPLVFAGAMSLPLAGHILSTRISQSHLTMSQALMQTRVFAQFGVISILLSTVSIRAFVEFNDHFGCRPYRLTDDDRYSRK